MEPTNIGAPDYFSQSRGLPVGVPRPYAGAGIYPALIAAGRYTDAYMVQLEVQRVPRHPRAHLRPALRTRLSPRPGRGG